MIMVWRLAELEVDGRTTYNLTTNTAEVQFHLLRFYFTGGWAALEHRPTREEECRRDYSVGAVAGRSLVVTARCFSERSLPGTSALARSKQDSLHWRSGLGPMFRICEFQISHFEICNGHQIENILLMISG